MFVLLAGADWATANVVIAKRIAAEIAARNKCAGPRWGSENGDMGDLRRILADQRA
jgi:hypothetical protein